MKVLMSKMKNRLTIGTLTVGTICCLMLVTGDIASAAHKYQTSNGQVLIEAENYTRLAGKTGGKWFKNTALKGYKGKGYMQAPSGDPKTLKFSSGIARVEYDIDFKETGTYYLHLRTGAGDHTKNGFFATINGKQFNYGHSHAYYVFVKMSKGNPHFRWYTDGGGAERRGCKVSFKITKKGVQTLAILRRDKSTRVDRIWLTKKQSTPMDIKTLNQASSGSSQVDDVDDPADSGDNSNDNDITVEPNGKGLIVFDTGDGTRSGERSNHRWMRDKKTSAWVAAPDDGTNIRTNYVNKSPFVKFNVNFTQKGTWYLWIQGSCQGKDNTVHAGLNGNAGVANISVQKSKNWAWNTKAAKLKVSKTGKQTMQIYMREDGFMLGEVVLTTDPNYRPK